MSSWPALQQIAVDLCRSLSAANRYARVLEAVRSVIPCDATALLALEGDVLVPLATYGLSRQVLGMRFPTALHPRLAIITGSPTPVRFPADSSLPDPFDGLVEGGGSLASVHDCLGCPLRVDGKVIGVLTADALQVGAFDPLAPEFLVALGALAGAALQTARLFDTIEALAEQRGQVVHALTRRTSAPMLGTCAAIERVRREIDTVATTTFPVLVLGETGVGKELAARAIHDASNRREAPFIQVNCAALPEGVIESELFGHVRGAFTGAVANRAGKFEIANGGTLFLDEIGELPLGAQAKLLRALQEGEVQRVGSDAAIAVDVRIVTATNRDLAAEVAAGRFRADLYHRLDVFPLHIPPLRERREDIALLAGFFLDRHRAQLGLPQVVLTPAATEMLEAGDWPGNIRELDHVLARAVLRAKLRGTTGTLRIEPADLDPAYRVAESPAEGILAEIARGTRTLKDAVGDLKRAAITSTLEATDGNWAEAARRLGMDRGNLHHLAQRLGIQRPR